jgi:hypothetical protein
MPTRSRDEVVAQAEGVYKLIRARKHLANRGAERACLRLLGSVIKKAERELFKPTSASLLIGALAAGSKQHSGPGDSAYLLPKQKTSGRPRTVHR